MMVQCIQRNFGCGSTLIALMRLVLRAWEYCTRFVVLPTALCWELWPRCDELISFLCTLNKRLIGRTASAIWLFQREKLFHFSDERNYLIISWYLKYVNLPNILLEEGSKELIVFGFAYQTGVEPLKKIHEKTFDLNWNTRLLLQDYAKTKLKTERFYHAKPRKGLKYR